MKRIALIVALAALAACSETESTTEAEAEVAAEPAATEAAVVAWPLEAGTYEYTRSDGRAGVNTVAADGTYSNAITGGEVETGTWGQEGDLSCLTPEGGEKRCYTFIAPDAEGNFSGSMADGTTVTGKKIG